MRRESIEDQLAKVPLFSHFSKKHLRDVSTLATQLNIAAGRTLIREGERGREFLIVLDGQAEVRRGDEVVAVRGPGEFFGEIALLMDRPRTASVVALTDMTVEVIDRQDFRRLLHENPELFEPLLAATAERLAGLEHLPH